jgi:hypothetical protein
MKCARILALSFCAMGLATAAQSQTWVSNTGNDVNACTISAPCKTFQRAVNVTPAGGQVGVLNAGDYGPVTITQSIRIDGGGFAANYSTSGNPFTINTPAGSLVEIRHLSIHGNGNVANMIYSENAGSLDIDDVQLSGFYSTGVEVVPTGVADVVIKDTSIENCSSGEGIFLEGASPNTLTAKIINTHVRYCGFGMLVFEANAAVYNSTFSSQGTPSSSGTYGIFAEYYANVFVDNCEINGFYVGIWSDAAVQVSRSSFIGNNTGVLYDVSSNGNNSFFNNVSNGTFSSTVPLM